MIAQSPLVSAEDIAGAIDWWRLAGVEVDARDEASGWFIEQDQSTPEPEPAAATAKPAVAPPQKPAAPPPQMPGTALAGLAKVPGDATSWPADLAVFRQWWMEEENFSPAGAFPRVPPRGHGGAALMVVVAQPEEGDGDVLLAGPHGALLAGFLRAAGLAESETYFASVLPRHTLQPDWAEVDAAGYGALLAHHIGLARPQRLIVFGQDILTLFPHEPAQEHPFLRRFNHEGGHIPLLPARGLANLARRGGFRARFWQQWLEFSDG
ncbi:hypothetical protein WAB17_11280 [Parerythrobacter aurantius]|uniref:hypothetical protein n=1 Tax=Parerythrobacter aurantius TaxID=3127706 RepID=UPI00324518EB